MRPELDHQLAGLGQLISIAAIPESKDNEEVVAGQLRVDSDTLRVNDLDLSGTWHELMLI